MSTSTKPDFRPQACLKARHGAKRIVVIPDIHQAPNLGQVEAAITRERPDLTVFLGDYFDRSGDQPRDAGRTAERLKHGLELNALPERMQLSVEAGAKRILIPSENKRDLAEIPDATLTAIQWQFYDSPTKAATMAIGLV